MEVFVEYAAAKPSALSGILVQTVCGALAYDIGKHRYYETPGRLAISGEFVLDTREGPIRCRPAFELFAARCRAMSPEDAAAVSGVESETIREAAKLLWHHRPVAHYTWTEGPGSYQASRARAYRVNWLGSVSTISGFPW